MATGRDVYSLPDGLPIPEDDGAADHLPGMRLPDLELMSTNDEGINLSEIGGEGVAVLFCYPRTGRPDEPLPAGWDLIPGARGCTPQSCAFRDLHAEFEGRGAAVLGLSAQSPADQLEFSERVHLPFPLVSDQDLRLAAALDLPTFETSGMNLYKRLTLITRAGEVERVLYPVFPPDRNAAEALALLAG